MRKAISKKMRAVILKKTNRKCGYCGVTLESGWHVDHMLSVLLGGSNDLDNLMASCRQCNNYKHYFTVDQFRREIGYQLRRLEEHSMNYRTALRFSLLKPTPHEIVFYFERMSPESGRDDK